MQTRWNFGKKPPTINQAVLALFLGLCCTLTRQSASHPTLHIQQPLDGEVPAHVRALVADITATVR
jgi:hypothetical protein